LPHISVTTKKGSIPPERNTCVLIISTTKSEVLRNTCNAASLGASRGINKTQITELTSGSYLEKGESILLTGATGCGKSFLASALGHQACSQGYKVLYYNTQKLMMKTKMTRIDGSFLKFFDKLANANLLILDDFGLAHPPGQKTANGSDGNY